MMVIWGATKLQAEEFRRRQVLGRGAIAVGNDSARSLDGMRPSAIVMLDGSGSGEVRAVLDMAARKSTKPVPWIDLRGQLA